ncbi:MAG: NUDIX domain-containing protein [Candidatus Magasanikbacteria bacterium]
MSSEILDVVNKNDKVVGMATQDECYAKKLLHRIVHVLIFDNDGKMALQKRSQKKKFCPGYWSTAVGGHVGTGEDYQTAAEREYQEELGINSELKFIGKDFYTDQNGLQKFLTTFQTIYTGKFNINPEAVDEIKYFTIEELRQMVNNNTKIHPELLFLLKKYYL